MKQLLPILGLAILLISLFFPTLNIYAINMDECLLEALKYADDDVTVRQLREQCKEETEQISTAKPVTSSAIEASSDGPEEIILKTVRARKPAYFPHRKHQERYLCGVCHHDKDSTGRLAKYTEQTVILKCTSCHNADMPNEKLNDFQLIGHKLCRECHRKNQDLTSAKCSTCHRKNLQ